MIALVAYLSSFALLTVVIATAMTTATAFPDVVFLGVMTDRYGLHRCYDLRRHSHFD